MAAASEKEFVVTIERFISSDNLNEQKEIVENIGEVLGERKGIGLLNIVEALGQFLTNQDITQRRKATQFLADLIHRLLPSLLNPQEIDVMTLFFCDRLQDHHSIQPQVIYGILGMVSYHSLTDDLIVKICQTMFAEVHVQSLTQADRRNTFNLFSNLLDKNVRALRRMGPDFVLGFIQSMDGEKDPRNLLVCFKNIEKIVASLPFEVFAEDLFEVSSCYFPIDFTPPANDPFAVTRDDLVCHLRDCLSSTRKFASFLLPLLIEKLSSDIVEAKIDSLLTFAASVLKYEPDDVKEFAEDLWNMVRRDFLLGGMNVLQDSCQIAIKNLMKCLEAKPEYCSKFLHVVIRDCEHALKDPDLAIAPQIGVILQTVAFSTIDSFELSMPKIMNILIALLDQHQVEVKLVDVLKIVQGILSSLLSNEQMNLKHLDNGIFNKMSSFLLSTISSTPSGTLQTVALNCLIGLMQHLLLAESEMKIVMDFVTDHISGSSDGKVQEASHKAIALICKLNLETEKGYIFAKLKKNILEILANTTEGNIVRQTSLENICKALTVSFSSLEGLEEITKYLVEKATGDETPKFLTAQMTSSIEVIVTNNSGMAVNLDRIITPPFLDSVADNDDSKIFSADTVRKTNTIRLLVSHLPVAQQEIKVRQAVDYYTCLNNGSNVLKNNASMVDQKFNHRNIVPVLYALITGLRADVPVPEVQSLLARLRVQVEASEDEQLTEYCCKIYSSLVNKMAEGDELDLILEETQRYIESKLDSAETTAKTLENLAMLLLWLTKAVLLRWHKVTPNMIKKVVSLCHTDSYGAMLCENFSVLLQDFPDVLNARMHARIKLMFKQRFVEFALPILVAEYKLATDVAKGRFLKAISKLLQELPKQVLQKKVSSLMPLLIRSLSFADTDILSSTLATIASLDAPDVIKEHVTSLVPRLLTLTGTQSLQVRLAAVRCLTSLCSLPAHSIYPYQRKVVKALKQCLDDKKRFVRKEAIKCRNQWYLLKGAA